VLADTCIAWNGIRLSIPGHWEARVAAPCHLIFEADFQPLLQLRWYQPSGQSGKSPAESQRLAAALARQGETIGPQSVSNEASEWADPWRQLESKFQVLAFSPGRERTPSGGAFSCPHCHTLFHFQTFPDKMAMGSMGKAIAEVLAALSCHDHDEDLYRIQDFSLGLPPGFHLADYSFAPGLTRLSFSAGKLRLQTARLAPADERLKQQSLAEILLAQTGVADLQIRETGERNSCEGFRDPGIFRRLLLRLRRDRPFVRARIGHDPSHNRLLSLILSGSRPLPVGLLSEIADNYAIV